MRVVIAHGHIFKNAGSTFDWSLRRNFKNGFLDHHENRKMRQQRAEHLREIIETAPALRAISSHHMCNPFPEMENVHLEPVYFLRHPIERITSVYAFERRQRSDSLGARTAKKKSFREYVDWRMQLDVPRTIRDYQASNISGRHDYKPKQAVEYETLQIAMKRLQDSACVGVVDRYDESMVIFEERLRTLVPEIDLSYLKQNVTRRLMGKKNFEGKLAEATVKLGDLYSKVLLSNSYDLALYRMANQKLDDAINGIPDFQDRLDEFRDRCRKLNKG